MESGIFEYMWPFSKKKQEENSGPYSLYTTCDTLPLYIFRKCLESGDITSIVISGKPPLEVVGEAWANIFSEYIDLSGDNDAKALAFLKRDYVLLLDQVGKVDQTLTILELGIHTEEQYGKLLQIIKDEGFIFEKIHETEESFKNSIRRVRNRLAPLRLKIATMEKELLEYEQSSETGELPENYFLQWLVTLQKYGYRDYTAANKILTVAEFILAVKDYLKYVAEHNKKIGYGQERNDQ